MAGDGAGVSDKGSFGGAGGVSGAGAGSSVVVGGVHNPMFARFGSSVREESVTHYSDPTVLNPLFSRDSSGGAVSEPPSPHAVVVEGGGEAASGGAHSGSLGLYFSKRPAGAGKPGRSLLSGRTTTQPDKLTFKPLAVGSSRSVVGHDDSLTNASPDGKGVQQLE